jgi:hypothetical protein
MVKHPSKDAQAIKSEYFFLCLVIHLAVSNFTYNGASMVRPKLKDHIFG